MENNNITVIIPTMQKDVVNLNTLIGVLESDEGVSEIIVINNCKKPFQSGYSKVRVINSGKNLYVNPSWNLGITEAKTEYYALFNDDVLVCENFCSKVLDLIIPCDDFGILGMGEGTVTNTSDMTIPAALDFRISQNGNYERPFNWGVIIFGKKSNFELIPQNLKIMCGDDFLRYTAQQKNLKIYDLANANIAHLGSLTSSSSNKIVRMGQLDIIEYGKIDEQFRDTHPYKWAKKELSFGKQILKFLQNMFSLRNSCDRKHKIVTVCGIKLSIKNKTMKHKVPKIAYPASACDYAEIINKPEDKNFTRKTAAVFATFDKNGKIPDSTISYIKEVKQYVDYIVLVSDSPIEQDEVHKIREFVDSVFYQHHGKYDFGSYQKGYFELERNGVLERVDNLLFFNDSVIYVGKSLEEVFRNAKNSNFYGIVKSELKLSIDDVTYQTKHLQSWFLMFSDKIFKSEWFKNFLNNVEQEKYKEDIIIKYELGLSKLIAEHGYELDSYYPLEEGFYGNPGLLYLHEDSDFEDKIFLKKVFLKKTP